MSKYVGTFYKGVLWLIVIMPGILEVELGFKSPVVWDFSALNSLDELDD